LEKLPREAEQLELVLETVEAGQADRLATASPTVGSSRRLVDGKFDAFLSYMLLSDRSVVAPERRSSLRP